MKILIPKELEFKNVKHVKVGYDTQERKSKIVKIMFEYDGYSGMDELKGEDGSGLFTFYFNYKYDDEYEYEYDENDNVVKGIEEAEDDFIKFINSFDVCYINGDEYNVKYQKGLLDD